MMPSVGLVTVCLSCSKVVKFNLHRDFAKFLRIDKRTILRDYDSCGRFSGSRLPKNLVSQMATWNFRSMSPSTILLRLHGLFLVTERCVVSEEEARPIRKISHNKSQIDILQEVSSRII